MCLVRHESLLLRMALMTGIGCLLAAVGFSGFTMFKQEPEAVSVPVPSVMQEGGRGGK